MFLSLQQIKAARALLGWSQKDLAQHAGLNDDQIHSFEAGRTRSLDVLESIYKTFSAHGLDFIDSGVVHKKVASYLLDSYMELLDDITGAMPNGGVVLKHCVDDRRSTPEVIEKVRKMRESGIQERLTIADDNTFVTGNISDYRQIPAAYFASSEVTIIFLDRIAFFVEGQVLVIINKNLARVFKDQFEYWWQQGKVLHGA